MPRIGVGILLFTSSAPSPPEVASITPTEGWDLGMVPVTIEGVGFTGATGATVGGVALTSFVVVDDTEITGTIGAHAVAANVDVVVQHPNGNGTLAGAFDYVAWDPTET